MARVENASLHHTCWTSHICSSRFNLLSIFLRCTSGFQYYIKFGLQGSAFTAINHLLGPTQLWPPCMFVNFLKLFIFLSLLLSLPSPLYTLMKFHLLNSCLITTTLVGTLSKWANSFCRHKWIHSRSIRVIILYKHFVHLIAAAA